VTRRPEDGFQRRRDVALAGHRGDVASVRTALADEDGRVRATALGALARAGALSTADLEQCAEDVDAVVRRRVAEAAAAADPPGAWAPVLGLLDDEDDSVVETAAWACGELTSVDRQARRSAVDRLAQLTTDHLDPLVREAAVAALGSIGDGRGLEAILAATRDRPAVRRRAVLALAPFEGPEVDEALARAREDRDWQVRQAAEDLSPANSGSIPGPGPHNRTNIRSARAASDELP
jgi:HEAT repeat protein